MLGSTTTLHSNSGSLQNARGYFPSPSPTLYKDGRSYLKKTAKVLTTAMGVSSIGVSAEEGSRNINRKPSHGILQLSPVVGVCPQGNIRKVVGSAAVAIPGAGKSEKQLLIEILQVNQQQHNQQSQFQHLQSGKVNCAFISNPQTSSYHATPQPFSATFQVDSFDLQNNHSSLQPIKHLSQPYKTYNPQLLTVTSQRRTFESNFFEFGEEKSALDSKDKVKKITTHTHSSSLTHEKSDQHNNEHQYNPQHHLLLHHKQPAMSQLLLSKLLPGYHQSTQSQPLSQSHHHPIRQVNGQSSHDNSKISCDQSEIKIVSHQSNAATQLFFASKSKALQVVTSSLTQQKSNKGHVDGLSNIPSGAIVPQTSTLKKKDLVINMSEVQQSYSFPAQLLHASNSSSSSSSRQQTTKGASQNPQGFFASSTSKQSQPQQHYLSSTQIPSSSCSNRQFFSTQAHSGQVVSDVATSTNRGQKVKIDVMDKIADPQPFFLSAKHPKSQPQSTKNSTTERISNIFDNSPKTQLNADQLNITVAPSISDNSQAKQAQLQTLKKTTSQRDSSVMYQKPVSSNGINNHFSRTRDSSLDFIHQQDLYRLISRTNAVLYQIYDEREQWRQEKKKLLEEQVRLRQCLAHYSYN